MDIHRPSLPGCSDDLRGLLQRVGSQSALLISLMPHGRPQVVRACAADPDLVRRYNRDEHQNDRITWEALRVDGRLIDSAGQIPPGHSLAMPMGATVLAGYPTVLHLFRREQEAAFGDAEVALLREWAVENAIQPGPGRVFVLDRDLSVLLGGSSWEALDPELRRRIGEYVAERFVDLSDEQPQLVDRRAHAAGGARREIVRYVFSRDSVAHPGRAGVVVCIQPSVDEWAELSPAAVAAHGELARFLPALSFMRASAGNGVTLNDVAESVGLSPFHFHRRFVELMGMAPKQYLFECQIADAQKLLLEGQLELYAIARQTGFAHQSHFTSRFRQATGLTPIRWRKAALESQSV